MSILASAETEFPTTMSYSLRVRVRQQGFAFTRRDALEFGSSDEQLRAWRRMGAIRGDVQGAYYLAPSCGSGPSADGEVSRRRVRATLLVLGKDYFVTHQAALLAWDLPTHPVQHHEQVHVGHQGARRWCSRAGVRLHRVDGSSVLSVNHGIRTVPAALAIAQVGATCGIESAIVAADCALHRRLISIADLDAALVARRGAPGCAGLASMLKLVDARSESPGESRLRLILAAAGVPVTPQVVIRDEVGCFVARVDLAVDDTGVVIEFDGMLKYRGAANSEALVNEKRRQVALERLGYRVVRFVWADLDHPDRVVDQLL